MELDGQPLSGIIRHLDLGEWFGSLTTEERLKLEKYSGEGDALTQDEILWSSQTPQHFFWTSAANALDDGDEDFAIFLGEIGLKSRGSLVDRHFLFSTLINAHFERGDYERAKEYCILELEEFAKIGPALAEALAGDLPPTIICRDRLIDILWEDGNYDELDRHLSLLVQKGLLSSEQAQKTLTDFRRDELIQRGDKLLEEGEVDAAKDIFEDLLVFDPAQGATVWRKLGNYFLKRKQEKEALEYFQRAIGADPLVDGVRGKLRRLEKKLGAAVDFGRQRAIEALQEHAEAAREWWSKRAVARQYAELGERDKAWRFYNEAIVLRSKEGMPCDTIYPDMAKMLETERKFRQALSLYVLAFQDGSRMRNYEPPKYLGQRIDRCAKKLGIQTFSHEDAYRLVREGRSPKEIEEALVKLTEGLPECG